MGQGPFSTALSRASVSSSPKSLDSLLNECPFSNQVSFSQGDSDNFSMTSFSFDKPFCNDTQNILQALIFGLMLVSQSSPLKSLSKEIENEYTRSLDFLRRRRFPFHGEYQRSQTSRSGLELMGIKG